MSHPSGASQDEPGYVAPPAPSSDQPVSGPSPAYPPPVYGPPPVPGQPPAYGPPPVSGGPLPPGTTPAYAQQPAYPSQPYGALPSYGQVEPYAGAGGPAGQAVTALYPGEVASYPNAAPTLVTAGGRFGGLMLEALLMLVTLFVGWLIWSFFTWTRGQTPAKQILGYVVADAGTGEVYGWGRMLLREFVVKLLLNYVANSCSFGVYGIVDACMVFGDGQQTLHDRIVGSVVRYR